MTRVFFFHHRSPVVLYVKLLMSTTSSRASLIVQLIKNPHAVQETPVQFLGGEDPLEKG